MAGLLEDRHQQLAVDAEAVSVARTAVDSAATELAKSEVEVEETRGQLSTLYEHMMGVVTEMAAKSGMPTAVDTYVSPLPHALFPSICLLAGPEH